MKSIPLGILLALSLMFSAATASACMIYVPLEVRVAKANFIVQGEIVDVVTKDRFQHGTLKVTEVLKGDKETRQLKVTWNKPHEGPGIIAQNKFGLMASYPGDFSADENARKRTEKAMKTLKDLVWQKEGELEWTVLTEVRLQNPPVEVRGEMLYAQGQFFPLVRNPGKELQHAFYFLPHQTITGSVTTPKLEKVPVKHGRENKKAKPFGYAFQAVEPGEIASLGFGMPFPNFREQGVHQLILTYENKDQDGAALEKANVYQGSFTIRTNIVIPGADG